ncbi:hypothetical protein HYH02_010737 [Chlamydomonas schloesseri]|uniref:Uncharacterized protein n=1 Tax=Chlamydomonas schloesseri TaxID=2026947 RepID=A0A835W6G8_9CHLO|nr:hypothetical protein HYH02_010737 [Chlamydomonas schloesseri]|eukprot:KAG2438944.1 hypothetical protein HYH02_010737 [Chlamydomonas schloesseri]
MKVVDQRIVEAEASLDSVMKDKSQLGFSEEDKLIEQRLDVQIQEYKDRLQHLRTEKQQLRTKEQDLRTEKQQLRTEKQQLRTEKQQLRTEEPSAHANALDAERQRDQQQGSASTWSASRKPTVWWPGGWLSLWPVRGGEDSQPLPQHLHGECDVAESSVPSSRPSSSGIGRYLGYTIFMMMLAVFKMLYSVMSKSVAERPTLVELLECCVEQGTWPLTTVGNIAGVWTALPMQKLVDWLVDWLVDCLAQPLAKLGTAWAAGLQSQLRGGRLAPLLAISPPATVASFLWSAAVAWFVSMATHAVMLAVCIFLAVQLMPFIWKAAGD